MNRAATFRIVAVVLLLLTGAEIFACEMIDPLNCEAFGFPEPGAGDNCICCCTHVVVSNMIVLQPIAKRVTEVDSPEPPKPENNSFPIYHPPRT